MVRPHRMLDLQRDLQSERDQNDKLRTSLAERDAFIERLREAASNYKIAVESRPSQEMLQWEYALQDALEDTPATALADLKRAEQVRGMRMAAEFVGTKFKLVTRERIATTIYAEADRLSAEKGTK